MAPLFDFADAQRSSYFPTDPYAAQPHMQAALSFLQNARGELQVAETNKAGHRVNAIRLVNEAIGEVHAGIAAGS